MATVNGIKIIKRKANVITNPDDINDIINITEVEACSSSLIMEFFGKFNGKERFHPYDIITIPAGAYGPEGNKNTEPFTTTVGDFVFNKAVIENELFDIFGYLNSPVTAKVLKKNNKKISYSLMEDKIEVPALKHYLLKLQKFQPYSNILSPGTTENMLKITKAIAPYRDELVKKYADEIKNNDPLVAYNIENELLDYAKKVLAGDPCMDMFDSGAKISWGNNFKNMYIFRGSFKNSDTNKGNGYSTITTSYMEGIKKDEFAKYADSLVGGPFSRSKKTEVGGAWEKLFVKSLEHLKVLKGKDCHTKRTITVKLTDDNISMYMYNYIVNPNGSYTEITSDNMKDFIGKTVHIRYASLCEAKDGICNICAGNMFTRLGMENVGVATYKVPCTVKLKSMKAFHDATVKYSDIEKYGINKIFGFEE